MGRDLKEPTPKALLEETYGVMDRANDQAGEMISIMRRAKLAGMKITLARHLGVAQ